MRALRKTARLYFAVNMLGWAMAALSRFGPWGRQTENTILFLLIGLVLFWNVYYITHSGNRQLKARLMDIAELNHVIRNSLQVIVYQSYVIGDTKHTKTIIENVDKIDKILAQLFPIVDRRKVDRGKLHRAAGARQSDSAKGSS